MSCKRNDPGISIARVAEIAQTTVRSLRYYEEIELLIPERTQGNKRVYSKDLVDRACLIAELRRLGLSVLEIGELLEATTSEDRASVREAVRARLADLDRQRSTLAGLLERLSQVDAA